MDQIHIRRLRYSIITNLISVSFILPALVIFNCYRYSETCGHLTLDTRAYTVASVVCARGGTIACLSLHLLTFTCKVHKDNLLHLSSLPFFFLVLSPLSPLACVTISATICTDRLLYGFTGLCNSLLPPICFSFFLIIAPFVFQLTGLCTFYSFSPSTLLLSGHQGHSSFHRSLTSSCPLSHQTRRFALIIDDVACDFLFPTLSCCSTLHSVLFFEGGE